MNLMCNKRYWTLAAVAAAGLAMGSTQAAADEAAAGSQPTRVTKQDSGKIVYWVLPGPRKLSKKVFGTPEHPMATGMKQMQMAEKMVAAKKMPPAVLDTLKKLPILVGVPMMARSLDANGDWWFKKPSLFSDKARIVQGDFEAKFWDVVKKDPPGPPMKTADHASLSAHFTDPMGNKYRVELMHVVKPPFPGYETDGGVMIDGIHHGSTGTGSPLMPAVHTKAAFWGVGNVFINGKMADSMRVVHLMTTEVVRDKDYKLALDENLPLSDAQRHVKGQATHTHLVVLPIEVIKGVGPTFKPLKTAFKLPNGMFQPFIHVMYEQDQVVL